MDGSTCPCLGLLSTSRGGLLVVVWAGDGGPGKLNRQPSLRADLHRALPFYRLFVSETLLDGALPSSNTHFPFTIFSSSVCPFAPSSGIRGTNTREALHP